MDQESAPQVLIAPPLVEPVYTMKEVGKMLKVSQRTVQEWVHSGVLSCVQYGKHLRIRPTDLAAFGKVRNGRPTPIETPVEADCAPSRPGPCAPA